MPRTFYHLEYQETITIDRLMQEWHEDVKHGYVYPCTFAQYMEMLRGSLVEINPWQREQPFAIMQTRLILPVWDHSKTEHGNENTKDW